LIEPVAPAAALANSQYLVYDSTLAANATVSLSIGITLNSTDVIRVYSSSADLSFNVFGTEIA